MIFAPDRLRWFTIPGHRPFLDDLAAGLVEALPDPERLAGALVLTPSRRGARALAEAFLKAAPGPAALLPQIRALGDLDEGEPPFEPADTALDLPPAITPLRRRFELAGMLTTFESRLTAGHALELADALAALLDSAAIEEAKVRDGLAKLIDLDLAEHWQVSAEVLELALGEWPRRLAALGLMDVSERRVALLHKLAEHWTQRRPGIPIIAAGSTGTAPATAALLGVVADLPMGAVVLPGLDQDLADRAWAKIDDQHPQASLKHLLDQAKVTRSDVRVWRSDADMAGRWRRRLVNEALRPAEATADWLAVIGDLRREARSGVNPFEVGLAGLTSVTARHEEEAAAVCAVLMREALETPGKTCALVTPDQTLARRVSARLSRWGIRAESTAGHPLGRTPAGALALAAAALAVDPDDPVARLHLLKSPLSALGGAAPRETLERHGLRGPRPLGQPGLETRLGQVAADHPRQIEAIAAALDLSRALDTAVQPIAAPFAEGAARLPDAVQGLAAGLEALCGEAVWSGPEGEALARLFSELMAEGAALPPISALGFETLIRRQLNEAVVRDAQESHPRLAILGALEARLTRADRVILAGLEEGTWPKPAPTDPFLSRPMRKALGLPSPERRIGLAAHDFAQGASAPEVYLIDSARREGAPATPSRWLWRLRTLAKGAGVTLPERPELLDWARALDADAGYGPVCRPAPRPPVAARPRRLSVTRIETLTRDPYAIWARDILKFYALDRPDQPADARTRGSAIHSAFEDLAHAWEAGEPADPVGLFEARYLEALAEAGMGPAELAREKAMAREAANWVAEFERRRRADGRRVLVETEGKAELMVEGVAHTLTAKADRLEITPDGLGHVLDFKTGAPPSKKQINTGFSPQLTLTAAILTQGGFGVSAQPGDLTYVRVTGRQPAGEEISPKLEVTTAEAATTAWDGARALLAAYLDPNRGYPSRVAPQFVKQYASDYDHLARVFEWSTGGEEGDE